MARYSWTRKITDLLASSRGKRRLQSWHMDSNFGALDNRVEALTGAMFVSGGVSRPGTLSVSGTTLTLTSEHVGVTLDGYTALAQASGSTVSTAGLDGKVRLVVAPTPVTEAHTWPEPLSPGEVITDQMIVRLGQLVALTGGTLGPDGYPAVPATCVPVATLTCNAGVATVDEIDSKPPVANTGLRGVGISGAAVDGSGHLILTYTDGTKHDAGAIRGSSALSTLTDVTLTALTAGQVLSYDGTHWINVDPSGGGSGGIVRLSGSSSEPTVVHRVPTAGPTFSETNGVYAKVIPNAPFQLLGIRDAGQTSTVNVGSTRGVVWRGSDRLKLADELAVFADGVLEVVFPAAVTLDTSVEYYIGWYNPDGNVATDATDIPGNAATWPGLVTDGRLYYAGGPEAFPTNVVGGYTVSFDLLQAGSGAQKGVAGPLDPVDMPVVTAAGALPLSSAAILDDGVNPPRLIRRRADGSVWYGTPFTNTP